MMAVIFFQPDISMTHDVIRIGYLSLNETETAGAIDIWKQPLTSFAAK